MKNLNKILIIMALLFVVLFSGCNSQTNNNATTHVVDTNQNSNNNNDQVDIDNQVSTDLNTTPIDNDVEVGKLI